MRTFVSLENLVPTMDLTISVNLPSHILMEKAQRLDNKLEQISSPIRTPWNRKDKLVVSQRRSPTYYTHAN